MTEQYEVTQYELDVINKLKEICYAAPLYSLTKNRPDIDLSVLVKSIRVGLQYPILRYLGKDETIEFKVDETKND